MREDVPLRSYLLVALGGFAYCCLTFVWFSLPAFLAPVSDALGLSGTEAGVLVGAIPLTYVPLSLASGLVVDRIGPFRAIGAGTVLFGIAQILRGIAQGFPSMLALTVLLGVGATAITFGLPKLVSELFPAERVGTLSTVYLLGSYAGTAAAYGIGRPVLGPALGGWRPLFVASGVAVLAFALCWVAVSRAFSAPRYGDDEPPSSVRRDLRRVFAHRELRLLVVVGSAYLFVTHGLQGWLPAVLESRGIAPAVAAAVASGFVLARVAGTLTVPPLSDALGRRRAPVVGCGVLAAVGAAGLLAADAGVPAASLAVAACGLGIGGVAPLIRALPTEMEGIGPRLTATAVGLVFAVGEVGGFLGPLSVGVARDLTGGFGPGVAGLAVAGAVMALAGLRLSDPAR
ncbi:CynX/NimT family MFS transporter [Halomarina halobia]|uniref:CynX/NimT family MFS transporter n=1 Tax=Halomarina halobia TaxID=3033386 RepID=A0ABD6A496_9EURY|nr:MFS transporter [Halomarina sp. PSR21]